MPDDAIERARRVLEDVISCGLDDNVQIGANHALEAMLAFASQQAPEGWRPIDTAPKDETTVDLWVASDIIEYGYRITDAWWCTGELAWLTSCADYGMPGNCLGPDDRATYWMPRPAPPAMLDAAPSVTLGEVG